MSENTPDKTATKTSTGTEAVESNNLAKISKFVLIGGSILPILTLFFMFLDSLLITINTSINAFGGTWIYLGIIMGWFIKSANIFSIICFFLVIGALILLALQYVDEARKNLFIAAGLYGAFTIFWIIAFSVKWAFNFTLMTFNIEDTIVISFSLGSAIFLVLALTSMILVLAHLNKFIKIVNEEHTQEIPSFKGHIVLIIFTALYFVTAIIGISLSLVSLDLTFSINSTPVV